jgi:hypothetical protein
MLTVTADAAMKAALRQANGLAQVCDADGTVIGFFAPVSIERAALYAEAAASIDPTLHKRQPKDGPNRTTAEVLDYLKTLESR